MGDNRYCTLKQLSNNNMPMQLSSDKLVANENYVIVHRLNNLISIVLRLSVGWYN